MTTTESPPGSRTGTATTFRSSPGDYAYLRAVAARTGVPISVIIRNGGRAEAERLAELHGCATEAEDARRNAEAALAAAPDSTEVVGHPEANAPVGATDDGGPLDPEGRE